MELRLSEFILALSPKDANPLANTWHEKVKWAGPFLLWEMLRVVVAEWIVEHFPGVGFGEPLIGYIRIMPNCLPEFRNPRYPDAPENEL